MTAFPDDADSAVPPALPAEPGPGEFPTGPRADDHRAPRAVRQATFGVPPRSPGEGQQALAGDAPPASGMETGESGSADSGPVPPGMDAAAPPDQAQSTAFNFENGSDDAPGQAAAPPPHLRRMKIALVICGAAVTVGMGAAIALLMEEASPPLRLGAARPAGAHAAAPQPAIPGSSGASGTVPGSAGAGSGPAVMADPACPLAGGPAACPAMVAIPGGRYRMGSRRTDPEAQAEELGGTEQAITPFELSAYEITAGQWQLCVNQGACPPPAQAAETSTMPVTGITWEAANAYTAWLSRQTGRLYRLPTEAEWEYAARAGAATVFPWGDQLGQRHAHCGQCGTLPDFARVAPVGSYPPQRGLYDMVGNAYEWVADCWTPHHGQPLPPSQSACRDKVQKGGAYDTLEADVRPVARTYGDRATADARVGFRVARQPRREQQ